jgi:hypothetical protein
VIRGPEGRHYRRGGIRRARLRTWLAGKLGLDGNPLRRHSDRAEPWIISGLLAVFLIAAPLLALVAGRWMHQAGVSEQRAQRSWHQTEAVLLRSAPPDPVLAYGHPWLTGHTLARWHGPTGRLMKGSVPVPFGSRAGRTVRIWVNRSGAPVVPPLSAGQLMLRVAGAAGLAVVGLALVLLALARAVRALIDRRRLRGWEADWAAVGPQWSRRL